MEEVTNEREVKYVEIDLDLEEATIDKLLNYGLQNIDRNSLINWAVNDILKKMVEESKEDKVED